MDNPVINQNWIKQIFFLLILVSLGALLFFELSGFLPALLGAITLYIVLRKWMFYLVNKKKWKKTLAAALLISITVIVILLPVSLFINMLTSKIGYAIDHSNELVTALKKVIAHAEQRFGLSLLSEENINKLGNFIARSISGLLGATFNALGTILFMYFILYFMLVNSQKMESSLYEHTPLKDENVAKLGYEVKNIVWSNAIGIPVIALMQGIVGLIGYLIIGVNEPMFWFVATCFTSMIPVVGAALAYIPLSIILFSNDQDWQGVAVLLYGLILVGSTDNIFRFVLIKKIGNVHPLITIFGVIIGLKLFGFFGLIFGPLLISIFILLLKIYSNEFVTKLRQLNPDAET